MSTILGISIISGGRNDGMSVVHVEFVSGDYNTIRYVNVPKNGAVSAYVDSALNNWIQSLP